MWIVLVVVGMFVFCWLFYIIVIIFKLFFDEFLLLWLVYLGFMFVIFNSCVNFVIYLVFDKGMWDEFKRFCFFCCGKRGIFEEDGVWSWWSSLNLVMYNSIVVVRISNEVVNKIIVKGGKEMNGKVVLVIREIMSKFYDNMVELFVKDIV